MKTLKRLLQLAAVSLVIATGLFFINSSIIVTTFMGKIAEILFLAIPVFIFITILYYANRALVKSVKGLKNKKPSGEGRP